MSESFFKIVPKDKDARVFDVYENEVQFLTSNLSPGDIALRLLDSGVASPSDRIAFCNMAHFELKDYSVRGLAAHSGKRANETERRERMTKMTEFMP